MYTLAGCSRTHTHTVARASEIGPALLVMRLTTCTSSEPGASWLKLIGLNFVGRECATAARMSHT